jgi:hypothetical protein
MKNRLLDLNNHLFAQIERLSDENLTPEQIETEARRGEAIVAVAEQIIDNAQLTLKAAALVAEHGAGAGRMLAPLIEGTKAEAAKSIEARKDAQS